MNEFYVYEHWRPDTNVCFYVGKGKDSRAWKMTSRNKWHKSIVSKLLSLGFTVDVRIVFKNLLEDEAHKLEKERIQFYGLENLCNISDGGEGGSGITKTPEQKEKLSKSLKEVFKNPAIREKISLTHKGKAKSEETKKKMSEAAKKRGLNPEYRSKMSIAKKNISEDTRKKMSEANLRRWAKKKEA